MSARQLMDPPVTAAPRRQPARAARLVAPAVMAAVIAIGSTPVSAASPPPAPAGWTTVFSDTFSGAAGSRVDSQWEFDGVDGTSNGSVQSYDTAAANLNEDGSGHLHLTPVKSGGAWTSSQVATVADSFSAPAGGEMQVSASIEQPDPADGQGYWPAFWMLGVDERSDGGAAWPADGEIDVLESINAQNENDNTFWYCAGGSETNCRSDAHLSSGLYSCPGCDTSFNTYSVIINRETSDQSISWYLNGKSTYSVSESQVGTSAWQTAVDHGFYLILDIAMGGSWPGDPTSSTTSGASMSVAYVAVYTTQGGRTPNRSPIPSPRTTPKPTSSPTSRPTSSASPTPTSVPTSSPPSPATGARPPHLANNAQVVRAPEGDSGAPIAGTVLLATLGGSVLLLIVAACYAASGLRRRISFRRHSR